MANYYVNPNGSETYPFDTEEKGAKDVNRLYKYLNNSSSEFINVDFDNYSSAIEVMPNHIAPFPKGEEKVIFKTIVKEYEIMPIYMGEIHGYSNYRLPSGCILGTQNISLSVWSFSTVTTWDDSMGRVTYTNHIRKGSNIKTFEKPFDINVSYYWVVDEYFVDMFVVPEGEELDLEDEPEWHNNHGQTSWYSFFGLGYGYQKYTSSLIGSISDGRTHIHSMSNYSLDKPAIALTDEDKILLTGDVTETVNLRFPDNLNYDKHSFNYALLTSIQSETKIKWTLSDSNYYFVNLNLDNLDIFTSDYNQIENSTKISNCYFHDFSWCGVSFSDWTHYTEGDVTCEISNNTFDNSMIYDSEGKYSLKINNNIFKNEGMIYCDDSYGTHNIYNNIFKNNSYIDLESRYYASMNKCIIANNTFTSLDSGYDAMYIIYRDNYGATMDLKMFNNVIDSGDIYLRLTVANHENIINFLHSNNCCPIYDYSINDIVVNPDPTEISTDPLFDIENIEHPLMLTNSSPCANTGLLINETPQYDILGNLRDSQPDMGAYEIRVEVKKSTNYVIEIYPNSTDTWSEEEDYGILADGIRLITGRPNFVGLDNKFYSDFNEIDINGNDISTLENTNVYYEGLLLKEGLSGPEMSVDVETTTNVNLDTTFSFSVRNDTGFYNYLTNNNIILNNRRVKFYVVIGNIFYSAGYGEISSITQSQDSISFNVEKSFKQIDKQIPDTYITTETDEETGDYKEEVMPIVLGDVEHSKILKEEIKILPIVLGDNDTNIVPAIYYNWFDPIHHEASWTHETGYYPYIGLYTGSKTFAANDPLIMGEPVGEYPYTYPNRKWLYVKYGEKAPKGMFRILGNSATVNGCTYIHIETNLTNSDNEILNPINFNNTLAIDPLQYHQAIEQYDTKYELANNLGLVHNERFYIGADGYDITDGSLTTAKGSATKKYDIFRVANPENPLYINIYYEENTFVTKLSYGNLYTSLKKGTEKTWWFQIVDLNVNTIVSNEDNFEIQTNSNNEIILDTYNSDTKKYENVSNKIDINSSSSNLIIKSNKIFEDETLYTYRRMPFKLLAFGACINSSNWIWSNDGFTGLLYYNNESHYYPEFFTTFEQADIDLVTNNKRNVTGVDNNVQWQDTYISAYDYTHYSYVHAKFEVNKSITELPNNVYFLVDCNRTSDDIRFNMRIGYLQWYAYDIYGNLIYSNNSGTTVSDTGWVLQEPPEVSHYNMFPNEFYKDEDLNGDYYTMFDAEASNGTDNNKKQLKIHLNLNKSEIPIKFENALNSDIIKEFVVILGFYHEFLHCDDWSKFKFEIKQLGIIAEEEVQVSDDDMFVKVKGERCSATSTEPLAETNSVYTAFVHLLEDYCKIDKKFIDYTNMRLKRYDWDLGRTLFDRRNAIEYINELSSNSFTQIYPLRNGKICLKAFDFFDNYERNITVETYQGSVISGDYTAYSKIKLYKDLKRYNLIFGYKLTADLPKDDFDYLIEYEGIYNDNGINILDLYDANNQLAYQVGYMNLGEVGGFIILMEIIDNNILFIANDYQYTQVEQYVDELWLPTITHDNSIIIKDSLKEIEMTDISDTYNNFKVQYNYDDNFGKFLNKLSVLKFDELSEFPSKTSNEWQALVIGFGDITYEDAKKLWEACKYSYGIYGAINDAQADVTELNWYGDPVSFDSTYTGENSVTLYFKLLIQWLTKQKRMVSYSVPINSDTVQLELLDVIYFKDVLLTNNANVTAFIIDKSINTDDDTIDLKVMFLPDNTSNPIDTIIETGKDVDNIFETGDSASEIIEGQ